jgi:hypothetical protein
MAARIRAFAIHFSLSCVVGLATLYLVFGVWYPKPLHSALGVTEIFVILLGVDVILGPLLTLMVYKTGKKSLRFDLAVIVFLQALAFAYGLFTVSEGRPVWLVFNFDHFEAVQSYQLDRRHQDSARPEFRREPWRGPAWAALRVGVSDEERKAAFEDALKEGVFVAERPEFYVPLREAKVQLQQRAKPLSELERLNEQGRVSEILAAWPDADAFLPMMAKVEPVTVLINKESANVVAIVPLKPW